jgi:hypothetical protein
MVRLINYKLLILLVSLITIQGFAQTSLYVASGTNFYITAGTDVYIDGIVIKPSINYNITGENSVTKDGTATPPPPATYIQRVYNLLQILNGYSGDITVYYQDAELNGLDENSLNLYVYNGVTWDVYIPTSRDAVNNYVTTTGLVNFALNAATLTNAEGAALPITLTGFTAQRNHCVANLKWTTATEQNSKHFEVQHSTDGVSFTTVGVVPSSGNSYIEKHYNFSINLNNQNNFFRLQMVDIDGSSKFSPTLRVTTNCSSNIITLFPNPTRNSVTITGLSSGDNQLRLLDNLGQVLKVIKTTNHTETINVSTLPSGTYVIQIIQKNEVIKNIKMIKE